MEFKDSQDSCDHGDIRDSQDYRQCRHYVDSRLFKNFKDCSGLEAQQEFQASIVFVPS